MRKSREEAAQTRRRIVEAASCEFRKSGIVATGLNDLMKAAGLTHGGFYKHFASKDQLVAEASAAAVDALLEGMAAAADDRRRRGGVPLDPPPGQSGLRLPARRARQRALPDPTGGRARRRRRAS